jgi:ubiquinone/menaquinone biosynthesis C-methylase UbiE
MLDLARYNREIHGCVDRVLLVHVDGKALPFEDDRFAGVLCKSMLHHIPEPRRLLAEAIRVTSPGGRLFVRDLLRPDSEAEVDRLVEKYAAQETEHARALFRASLHASLTLDEVRALVAEFGFDPAGVQQTSEHRWTWNAVK